jgi:hypothetical protein
MVTADTDPLLAAVGAAVKRSRSPMNCRCAPSSPTATAASASSTGAQASERRRRSISPTRPRWPMTEARIRDLVNADPAVDDLVAAVGESKI